MHHKFALPACLFHQNAHGVSEWFQVELIGVWKAHNLEFALVKSAI